MRSSKLILIPAILAGALALLASTTDSDARGRGGGGGGGGHGARSSGGGGGAGRTARVASVRSFSSSSHVTSHRSRRAGVVYRRVYAAPYVYDGDCAWLYRRAVATGSRVWWRRYYACLN